VLLLFLLSLSHLFSPVFLSLQSIFILISFSLFSLCSFSLFFAPSVNSFHCPPIYRQEESESSLPRPIVTQGGMGLSYPCRVRWSAICKAWSSWSLRHGGMPSMAMGCVNEGSSRGRERESGKKRFF
jgi:hypothetical protein